MRDDLPPPVDPRLERLLRHVDPMHAVDGDVTDARTDAAWAALMGATGSVGGGVVPARRRVWRRNSVLRTLRSRPAYVVASLAAVVVAVVAINTGGQVRPRTPRSTARYVALAGQQVIVPLAEGARARLGPMTRLTTTTDLAGGVIVQVSGEALFTVAHRANTSLQVRTANAVTRVLGTTFLVRRYATDRVTRVVVADGRVSVSGVDDDGRGAVLPARTLGTVDDSGHVSVTPGIATDDYTGWTTGRLVFRNTPIRDAMTELGQAYDVEFRVSDSVLAARHLNWTVPLGQQSLSGILVVLGDVLDARPVRTGRVITFVSGRSASRRSPSFPSSSTPERQYGK